MKELYAYMKMIIPNLNNDAYLKSVGYRASDKDCGYLSGLRFLKMDMTRDTDVVANAVIYPHKHNIDDVFFEQFDRPRQIEMEI